MAINNKMYDASLIHHSDRGSQYCSHNYVAVLLKNNIAISMTGTGILMRTHWRKESMGSLRQSSTFTAVPWGLNRPPNK
ncbi:MAG: hypothetical protein V7655_01960 [Aequorivita antarctica]